LDLRWLLLLAIPAGCQSPILTVDDAVMRPGHKTRLVAYVEREPIPGLRQDVKDVRVRFLVDGREVGEERTGKDGSAATECRLSPDVRELQARALIDREAYALGRVFIWDQPRVVIAVDVDQTIERTRYRNLLPLRPEDESDPVKRSAETLRKLAEDFHIVYLSGRPRFLLDRTRDWLREREFPDGPVVTAKGVRNMLRPGEFKRKRLDQLRDDWPTLLIGIGDQPSDAEAYGANRMLTLIVSDQDPSEFGPHALVFGNWKALSRFFEANREVLMKPEPLREAIKGQRMLLRYAEPYRKD
jgi:hypothetical protein